MGQTSFAALSQTVKTKFNWGAPGPANSSQCMTSCAIRREGRKSLLVHYGFGHDGTSGITRAEKQNVITSLHYQSLSYSKSVHSSACLVVALRLSRKR